MNWQKDRIFKHFFIQPAKVTLFSAFIQVLSPKLKRAKIFVTKIKPALCKTGSTKRIKEEPIGSVTQLFSITTYILKICILSRVCGYSAFTKGSIF